MLTALRLNDLSKVLARESEKTQAPFACPKCAREAVLHKGRIRVHHFKHKPPVTCTRGLGETEQHRRAKQAIYDALVREPNVTELEIEKDFGVSVADVYARIGGTPVAVEIQRNSLSVAKITARTRNYHGLGVAVLWAGLPSPELSSTKYSPSAWERWCHAAYFGRVYYWESGQTFRVVHFGAYRKYVEERIVNEPVWCEQFVGGYERTSKRYKTLLAGVPVLLSHGFSARVRLAWSSGSVDIPECRLYADKQSDWWSRSEPPK